MVGSLALWSLRAWGGWGGKALILPASKVALRKHRAQDPGGERGRGPSLCLGQRRAGQPLRPPFPQGPLFPAAPAQQPPPLASTPRVSLRPPAYESCLRADLTVGTRAQEGRMRKAHRADGPVTRCPSPGHGHGHVVSPNPQEAEPRPWPLMTSTGRRGSYLAWLDSRQI